MQTVSSTNRTQRIDRFGQVREGRESRSEWAKVSIGTLQPHRGNTSLIARDRAGKAICTKELGRLRALTK